MNNNNKIKNIERIRLASKEPNETSWKKWGPYLSERQWGTVREDYSSDGDAWDYFTHDHSRSRAYKWGEDGIAGICDNKQSLCFSVALWNGKDPILKERLFGLTNKEGNHGEDVKECYFYLDSTPTHSYMKYLYKYPQEAYPYNDIVHTNRERSRNMPEYELMDTGIFDKNKYFDVFIEYAKNTPNDILIKITIVNRGSKAAKINVLPTLWFRNNWYTKATAVKPLIKQLDTNVKFTTARATSTRIGEMFLFSEGNAPLLFTENETNTERIFGSINSSPYVKDGINNFIVNKKRQAINPQQEGTKMSVDYSVIIPAGQTKEIKLRLTDFMEREPVSERFLNPFADFDAIFNLRKSEADEFYKSIIPKDLSEDATNVMRQALANLMWSKQFYYFDIDRWLNENGTNPLLNRQGKSRRNEHWHHMYNKDVISMPDKWEYPWYAAWDLAFHVVGLTMVDVEFGKNQLKLMLQEGYMHPNGQIPAYEWSFGDVNPPVHAWGTVFTYQLDKAQNNGVGDITWLKGCFHKLLLNFTWWVNRKDELGNNIFEGGFLGLDNISVFDRSSKLPTGGYLEQADGTAWMALYCQNMLEIASELALNDPHYEEMLTKFIQHFAWIAYALTDNSENHGMWDEKDGFFYDVIRKPDDTSEKIKVRSIVGLIPFCATTTYSENIHKKYPNSELTINKFFNARPELLNSIHNPLETNEKGLRMSAVLNEKKLRQVLDKLLDENEFLSEFGIRSLSKVHKDDPFVMNVKGREYRVDYLPGESDSDMFGGNSNWRGPIWMPMNILITRALMHYYLFYGSSFKVECPTGSGVMMDLREVAEEINNRIMKLFLKDENGVRPSMANYKEQFIKDPNWNEYLYFYEYFHGDTGLGLGAGHQGWTCSVARLVHIFETIRPIGEEQATSRDVYFQAINNE
jgi:hypothetical protein